MRRGTRHISRQPPPELAGNVQRGELLDMPGLQSDVRDMESRILCDLNGIKLGGVESPRNSPKRTFQSSMGRVFLGEPKTSSRAGTMHQHDVPSLLVNLLIENRRRHLFLKRPVVAEGFPEWPQTIWQDASPAQED